MTEKQTAEPRGIIVETEGLPKGIELRAWGESDTQELYSIFDTRQGQLRTSSLNPNVLGQVVGGLMNRGHVSLAMTHGMDGETNGALILVDKPEVK